jgi:SPX domain protein involved in polyphosphate accumulation
MKYRHEAKIEIGYSDLLMLRQRLSIVMQRDKHAIDGRYEIRSLYFDNARDKALREKIDGVNVREKFRIRFYNGDTSYIKLEKKSKINGLCHKSSAPLTRQQAEAIARGDYEWMCDSSQDLVRELYIKMKTQGLRPKTVVDYTREPFVYPPGNVRVTLDYNIRTGMSCTDFLENECVTVPIETENTILEVKWDEYLPDIIRDIVHVQNRHVAAFSKYAACRIYG